MKLITQTGPDCLVTSAAMVLGVEPEVIFEHIGHRGYRNVFPGSGTGSMQGIHIREIMEYANTLRKYFVPIEFNPMTFSPCGNDTYAIWDAQGAERGLRKWLRRPGILIGTTASGGPHACAWDGHMVYDPKGLTYSISEISSFQPHIIWVLIP